MEQQEARLTVEIITKMAQTLNNCILTEGQISINNSLIWNGWLHKLPNEVWYAIAEVILELAQQHPSMVRSRELETFSTVIDTLNKWAPYYDQVLDMRTRHVNHKPLAWRAMQETREIWCRCTDTDLPNTDDSKTTSTYTQLFGEA